MGLYRDREGKGWTSTNAPEDVATKMLNTLNGGSQRWRKATRWEHLWYGLFRERFSLMTLWVWMTMLVGVLIVDPHDNIWWLPFAAGFISLPLTSLIRRFTEPEGEKS